MIKKQQQFLVKGMNQDIAQTKIQSEFAHSIKNLRVVTDEKDGTLSLVTEKGTNNKNISLNNLSEIFPITPTEIIVNATLVTSVVDNSVSLGTISTSAVEADLHYSYTIVNANVIIKFDKGLPNVNRTYFAQWCAGTSNIVQNIEFPNVSGGQAKLELHTLGYTNVYYTPYNGNGVALNNISLINGDYSTIITDNVNKTITINIPVIFFNYIMNGYAAEITNCISNAEEIIKSYIKTLPFNYERMYAIKNVIGSCIIKNDIVLFGKATENTETLDIIFKVKNINSNNPTINSSYLGKLNFDINHPIKTYLSYENESTQKIYWVDGINQPRVINVANDKKYEMFDTNLDNHFEFCTPIYCDETIKVTKKSIGGFFHSGVIQYFVTYVDQNDQESKIFFQSPLFYITDNDRALSPEEMSTNSFNIELKNINANKLLRKRLRIYSLQRTSLNATPVAKLIYDLKLTEETSDLTVVDTGNIGHNIDPQVILLLGCDEFVPQTMAVKDNTVFFGNIEAKNYQHIPDNIAKAFVGGIAIKNNSNQTQLHVNSYYSTNFQLNGLPSRPYNGAIINPRNKNGSDNEIKGFMYNEEYMLGLQFLHKSGEWSEPIWCGDYIMNQAPECSGNYQYTYYFYKFYNYNYFTNLVQLGYIAVRPLVVFNDQQNCRVLCQGVLNPTLKHIPTGNYIPSWFFRIVNRSSSIELIRVAGLENFKALTSDNGAYLSGEVQGHDTDFKVSTDLMTFNSPEIEFEKITSLSKNYNFKYIGGVEVHANTYDIEMLTSTTTYKNKEGYGLLAKRGIQWYSDCKLTFIGGFCWKDKDFEQEDREAVHYIYPWENNQSYSCAPKSEDDIIYSAPERKIISNYRYSQFFKKITSDVDCSINSISLCNSDYIRTNIIDGSSTIEAVYIKDPDILCIGDVDGNDQNGRGNRHLLNPLMINPILEGNVNGCNIVRVQYKTTPHIILNLSDTDIHISGLENNYGIFQVGELINNAYSNITKFKGRIIDENGDYIPTDTSMYENTWYIAGDTIKLPVDSGEIEIKWTKGDTYYQRYDCLKTYPYSHEAQNSIVDILSCMIQTRINLDGRYNKNRCSDILHIDPTNFNKLNDVYSQQDNFFTYHKLDPDRFQNVFPNLVIWSKQKVFGETSDSWTNIHLTNVLDLDGSLGEITAIKLWNNKLIAFQNKGISVIKYNENVMVPSVSGTLIELMNSGLVTGKEYITNQFGCQNEWSIVNAKSGLYFSDDFNQKLYVISDGIKCISDNLGFRSYLKNKSYSDVWKPNINAGKTLHTFYDQQLGEIYFTDGTDCLTFNENLNLFTAFYDYKNDNQKKLFNLVNIENKNYWILNDFNNNGYPLFYEHRTNDYLNIFDINCDYSIELTSNIDPHIDKIFDIIEIRGDSWENDNLQSGYGYNPPFNKLQVTNEYQDTGEQILSFIKDRPNAISNIKQKFRIWRANVGRNQNSRDRIRNYWSRIKLVKNATNKLRAKIHDIIVNVYE